MDTKSVSETVDSRSKQRLEKLVITSSLQKKLGYKRENGKSSFCMINRWASGNLRRGQKCPYNSLSPGQGKFIM